MKAIHRVLAGPLVVGVVCACGGGGDGGGFELAAELLQNGSFESPTQADGTLQRVTAASWTGGAAITNPNANGNVAGNIFAWPQPGEGQQYCDIGNVPATRLSQSLTVETGGTYRISWRDNTALNVIVGFRTSPYRVVVANAAGEQMYAADFDAYRGDGVWAARSFNQALPAGTYMLSFTSLGTTGNGTDTLIDDVSVKRAP